MIDPMYDPMYTPVYRLVYREPFEYGGCIITKYQKNEIVEIIANVKYILNQSKLRYCWNFLYSKRKIHRILREFMGRECRFEEMFQKKWGLKSVFCESIDLLAIEPRKDSAVLKNIILSGEYPVFTTNERVLYSLIIYNHESILSKIEEKFKPYNNQKIPFIRKKGFFLNLPPTSMLQKMKCFNDGLKILSYMLKDLIINESRFYLFRLVYDENSKGGGYIMTKYKNDFSSRMDNYFLRPQEVKNIRYKKHFLYPGYLIEIPEFKIQVEVSSENNAPHYPLITVKNHEITFVKNIDLIKNAQNEIEKREAVLKLNDSSHDLKRIEV